MYASCPLVSGNLLLRRYLTDLQNKLVQAFELGGRRMEAMGWVKSVEGASQGSRAAGGSAL